MLYLLLPSGIVLLLIPLNTHRIATVDRDFVFLQITETLGSAAEAKEPEQPLSATNSLEDLQRQIQKQQKALSKDHMEPGGGTSRMVASSCAPANPPTRYAPVITTTVHDTPAFIQLSFP